MKKKTLHIAAVAATFFATSLSVSAQDSRPSSPPALAGNNARKVTVVAKETKSNPLSIGGRTYANQADFNKVSALINQKVKSGLAPAVVTDKELSNMNIVPVSNK